jgi:D-sedoheptulose 7-phosphate isomerase
MKNNIKQDREILKGLFDQIRVTDLKGKSIDIDDAIITAVHLLLKRAKSGGRLLLIGNGGSASIASHIVTDFVKSARIPAMAFNDSSLLTCLSNDLGYEHVFENPVGLFASKQDTLIAISSSGQSKNILLGVSAARKKKAMVITFSGFKESNPLRKLGDINFYVPSKQYGHVEIVHLAICHLIADMALKVKNG